uniref:Hdr-like menaquinol oxidoreductase cytochrome c subunit n=1 Tax=Anaerolinea thermolimosa TaxID=229919 RepID=A0A7C4PM22_9CHLR
MIRRLLQQRGAIVLTFLLMTVPLLCGVVTFAAEAIPPEPWLENAQSGATCILPREAMRHMHMSYLKTLRDQVVRQGDRSLISGKHQHGITSCRGCHEHRETFCNRCHQAASVRLDCFNCHAY